jgi:phosphoglycerate dehydrogenase-like enzyme
MQESFEKKIILTLRELSDSAREKLEKVAGMKYQIRLVESLKDSEYSSIEILLLDTARGDDRNILSEGKIEKFVQLKLIQSTRAGVDALDFGKIPSQVLVCGNVGAYGEQMAEHVFGMLLYFARNIGLSDSLLKQGIWEIPSNSLFLKDKTITILGTGGIGDWIAKLAGCFGMKTVGVNTSGHPVPKFDQVFSIENLDEALGYAEIVVVALPLTVKTFHLIDRDRLGKMKKDAILVNVARGYIIDEAAVYKHLQENHDFRAALDVWWWYPKKGEKFAQRFPFFELPNFLGTPHDSGIVPETEELALLSAIENIGRFVRNEPLKGLMDRTEYVGLGALIDKARLKQDLS